MKYGLNLLLWTTDVTDDHFPVLENIREWGYDGVEIPVFDLDPAKFKKLGKKLDQLELERTAVTISTLEENPISEDPKSREAAVARLCKAVDMCALSGATKLCGPFHSALGHFSGRGPTSDEWGRCKDVLARVADHAQKQGVQLVLEYLNRFECYFLNSAADASRFVNEVDHPALRMMYDTFHANIEEKCPAAAIKTCAPVMVHVHISENDRSTPGEGNVDWYTTFQTLREVNYDGWMVVEAFGLALPALAAATKIWRRMYPSEEHLAKNGLKFMQQQVEAASMGGSSCGHQH